MKAGGDSDHGVVAIVQGLRNSGVAITLVSKAHLLNSLRHHREAPISKCSVETCTEEVKQNTSTQICNGAYTTTYQLAHCHFSPNSPSEETAEFPPRNVLPGRSQGNNETDGSGSCGRVSPTFSTSIYKGVTYKYSRGSFSSARFSHTTRTDSFIRSLRKYPVSPDRSLSSEFVQRLVNYTQAKYLTRSSLRSLRSPYPRSPRQPSDKTNNQSRNKSSIPSRDKSSLKSRKQSSLQSKDKSPNNLRDKNLHQARNGSPFASPERYRLPPRNQSSVDQSPIQFRDKRPQSYEKSLFQPRDTSPLQIKHMSHILSRDNKAKKPHRRTSKKIQTYTRTANEDLIESVATIWSKKSIQRKISHEDVSHTHDHLRETYNYLKATQSERLSYFGHRSEVRFINDVKRCIRDTLKQMVDGTPCVCPKLQERKSLHMKSCHSRRENDTMPQNRSTEVQASLPSTSKNEPKPVHCPYRIPCPNSVKSVKKDRGSETQDELMSKLKKMCPLKRQPCTPQPPCAPCYCPKKSSLINHQSSKVDNKIEDLTNDWLKYVPVSANETPNDKAVRQTLVKNLAQTLKILKDQEDYLERAKEEIKTCLDNLPMWYPGTKRDREIYKMQIAANLLDELKSMDGADFINLNDVVADWLDNFHIVDSFKNTINTEELIENCVNRLKPKINRPLYELKEAIVDMIKELGVNNVPNEVADGLVSNIKNLRNIKDKATAKFSDEKELTANIRDWLDTASPFAEQITNKNRDLIDDLAHRLKSLESDNADDYLLEQEIKNFFESLLERGFPFNRKDENKLIRNLVYKTKSKQRKKVNQDTDMEKLILGEISELIDDIPVDNISTNRQIIKEEIADMLAYYIKNESEKEEVNRKIIDILRKEAEIPDIEVIDFANTLMSRVKGMPIFRQPTITAAELRDIVKEEINHILEYVDMPSNDKSAVEQSIIEVLTDQIVLGTDDSETNRKIINILQDANVSNGDIRDICNRLMERHREMSSSYRSIDSTLKLLKSMRKRHLSKHNPTNENPFQKDLKNLTGDESLNFKYERKEAAELGELLATSSSNDTNKDEISDYTRTFSIKTDGPRVELAQQQKQTQNVNFKTSTPRKKGSNFFPKRDNGNLSAIKYDSGSIMKSQIYQDEGERYKNELKNLIESWMNEIGLKLNGPEKQALKFNWIKELAEDIEDRQKYLQINPDIKMSHKDELEHLKYQVFKLASKLPSATDLTTMMPQTEALMNKIKLISVPLLDKSKQCEFTRKSQEETPSLDGSRQLSTLPGANIMSNMLKPDTFMVKKKRVTEPQLIERRKSESILPQNETRSLETINKVLSKYLSPLLINSSEKLKIEYLKKGLLSRIKKIKQADPTNESKLRQEIRNYLNKLPIDNNVLQKNDIEGQLMKNLPTGPIESYETTSDNSIIDAVSEWIKTLVLQEPNTLQDINIEDVEELMSALAYLLIYRSKVPLTVINEIEKAVADFIGNVPLDIHKTPNNKDLAISLFNMVKKRAKGPILPTKYIHETITKDLLKDNTTDTPLRHNQDMVNKVDKKLVELRMSPETSNDDFRYEQIISDKTDDIVSSSKEDSKIGTHLTAVTKPLTEKVNEARKKSHDVSPEQKYTQKLRDAITNTLPYLELSVSKQSSFEILKDNLAKAFKSVFQVGDDENQKKLMTKKINDEISKLCDDYTQNHPESAIDAKQLHHDLFNAFNNILESKDKLYSIRKDMKNNTEKRVRVKKVPLKEQPGIEKLPTNKNISPLDKKSQHTVKDKNMLPGYDYKVNTDITKLVQNLPVAISKEKLIHHCEKQYEKQKISPRVSLLSHKGTDQMSRLSTSTHYSTRCRPEEQHSDINKIDSNLDLNEHILIKAYTPEQKSNAKKIKKRIVSTLNEKVAELNTNPEVLNDDIIYEHMLEYEINELLTNLANEHSFIRHQLPAIKKNLQENVMKSRQKIRIKQMLKRVNPDAVSRTSPSQNLSVDENISLEKLQNSVAEALINLQYAGNDEKQKNMTRKKITEKISTFCDNYTKAHPKSPINPHQLLQDIFNTFDNVSESPEEFNKVQMQERVNTLIKNLPLKEQTFTEKQQNNKTLSEFAKTLSSIEKEKELFPDKKDYDDRIKKEVSKLVQSLPLTITKEKDINKFVDKLVNNLNNTDHSRKVSAPRFKNINLNGKSLSSHSYSATPVEKRASDVVLDDIANLCNNIPIKVNTPAEMENATKFKQYLADEINKIVNELNLNLEVLNDSFLYENLLKDALDNIISNFSNKDSNITIQLPDIQDNLLKNIKKTLGKTSDENIEQLQKQLYHDISTTLPSYNAESESFEKLKKNVAAGLIDFNYSGYDEIQKNRSLKKIDADINTFCNYYSKKHPESPIDPEQLRQDFFNAFINLSDTKAESFKEELELVKKRDEVNNWLKDLPFKEQTSSEQIQTNKMKAEFAKKLYNIQKEKELHPNKKDYDDIVKKEFEQLLKSLPLLITKNEDINELTKELLNNSQNLVQLRKVSSLSLKDTHRSKSASSTFSEKSIEKSNTDFLFDEISNWSDKLDIKADTTKEMQNAKIIKQDIASKIFKVIGELNINPETFNDNILYEQVLQEEIDKIMSNISYEDSNMRMQLPVIKKELLNKVKDARQKTQDEYLGKLYKQRLREAISETLPSQELSVDTEASFEVLKNNLVDAFINLHYVGSDDNLRNKLGKKIKNEISNFCNNYLNKYPTTPIDTKQLNLDLYNALKNVSEPKNQSFKNEVELVKIKDEINDWFKDLPLKQQTGKDRQQADKIISVLSKKLHNIEKEKEIYPNLTNYNDKMKNEIMKFMKKLPLMVTSPEEMNAFTDTLISNLKNTERTRHVRALTRSSIDSETFLNLTHSPSCCCLSHHIPSIPPSTLSVEDRAYLQRIRERKEKPNKTRLSTSTTKDVSLNPLPVDASNQTEIGSPDSTVNGWQDQIHPCSKITPPSQRKQAVKHQDPNVIIKQYHWDSIGSSMASRNKMPYTSAFPTPTTSLPSKSKQTLSQSDRTRTQQFIPSSPPPCQFSRTSIPRPTLSQGIQPRPRPLLQSTWPETDQINASENRQHTSPYRFPCSPTNESRPHSASIPCSPHQTLGPRYTTPLDRPQGIQPCPRPIRQSTWPETTTRKPDQINASENRQNTSPHRFPCSPTNELRPHSASIPCSPHQIRGPGYNTPLEPKTQSRRCNSRFRVPCPATTRCDRIKAYDGQLILSKDYRTGPCKFPGTSRMTHQGYLRQTAPRACRPRSHWKTIPEEGCKYWERIRRPVPSRSNFQLNEQEMKERNTKCKCNEKFLTECRMRRPNIMSPNYCANDSIKRCTKCCGVHCPYPCRLFFSSNR